MALTLAPTSQGAPATGSGNSLGYNPAPSPAPHQGGAGNGLGYTPATPAGGSGGNGLGFTPAPGQTTATGPAATDPAYLAFLRQMGVDESQINSTAAYRVGALNRQIDRQAPQWDQQSKLAGEGVDNDYESRGMLNSGKRFIKRAEATTDVDRQRLDWEAGIRDQIGEQYITSAQDIADLRRQAAEQAIAAAQATAIANANAGIYN